jgi:hypothetical protein
MSFGSTPFEMSGVRHLHSHPPVIATGCEHSRILWIPIDCRHALFATLTSTVSNKLLNEGLVVFVPNVYLPVYCCQRPPGIQSSVTYLRIR